MKPELKQAILGIALLVSITLFFGILQQQIEKLRLANMTWSEWAWHQVEKIR